MISLLQRKSLTFLHPILKRLVGFYLRKPRPYRFRDIRIIVYPTVFHPGLFYSTKFLISFLERQKLNGLQVLELGAGSGLISLFSAKQGAIVTATDINTEATRALRENASKNDYDIQVIESDLFEKIAADQFDWIVVNPPYYPKNPNSDRQAAWYCGENHEYFRRLFAQWKAANSNAQMIMVLSEDCDLKQIQAICEEYGSVMKITEQQKIGGELNFIFEIKRS